ncbi:MAG: hypothetical protein ACFFC1_02155 [Promethearchaeota archaeon]
MTDNTIQKQDKNNCKELLIEDYKYLCESFRENEQIGERRMKFFITLVTAIMAALATLATSNNGINNSHENHSQILFLIILFSLFFLLILGTITLLRMLKRNQVQKPVTLITLFRFLNYTVPI